MAGKRFSVVTTAAAVLLGTGAIAGSAQTQDRVAETEYYRFHSDPWINLHHFLYQWARADLGVATGRRAVAVPERDRNALRGDEAEAWSTALEFYAANLAELGHFDLDMLELKTGLTELDADPGAEPPDVFPGISGHLSEVMPVYLRTWWPEHDRMNRSWIDRVIGDVRRHEADWVETASRVFDGEWIDGRLRVDASAYGNWAGGYTSNGPGHTVIVSADETNNEGLYGLELVFHESGHIWTLQRPSRRSVSQTFRDAGVDEPGDLWHGLIFASAGELVRGIAASRGLPEHVPYVELELTGFRGWAEFWPAVQRHWMPVVRGEADREQALRAIADQMRPGRR